MNPRELPPRQSGVAALGMVALLLMCCAAWLATDWLRLRIDRRATLAVAQAVSLRQADQALAFFAAARARLPCPAIVRGGREDCGGLGRGWLPSVAPGVADSEDMPMRYELPDPQGDAAQATARSPDGYDFCARLRAVPGVADDAGPWLFPLRDEDTVSPQGIPVAYSLIAGASASASAISGAVAEGGFRTTTGRDAVHASLECASATASLDALLIGAGWTGPAIDLRATNAGKADALADGMRFLLAHRTLELDLAMLDLGAGLYALLDNQTKLEAAIAATLAGVPPPADAIPSFVAGIASAAQALRLNAVDIPRAAVSLALDEATLGRYRVAARQALRAQPWRDQDRVLSEVRELGLGAGAAVNTGTRALH